MTQEEMVMRHLEQYGSITALEALQEYGIMRLGARIWDLKDSGKDIVRDMEIGKNRFGESTCYARYRLKKSAASGGTNTEGDRG